MTKSLMRLGADNIRILSAEGVQKANSGHPGMPMGCADFAFALWHKHLRHNPANPSWLGRDRFVLSAGHGSMLLYSLLHLYDYLPLDELKQFRQWGSKTPGHPEYGHTAGVDVTTGPLGSGFASAVGMAIALKNFAARTGLDATGLFKEQRVWIIAGDGCMMEGTTHEAASLAGHLRLDSLVCFYDDNHISIEGDTKLAFTEDVRKRFDAYGWRVVECLDANDEIQVEAALRAAKASDGRPTLIAGRTKIGFGSPKKAGSHHCHGEPLGAEELAATKAALGFPPEPFTVLPEVREACQARVAELTREAAEWDARLGKALEANHEAATLASALIHQTVPGDILPKLLEAAPKDKPAATRNSSGAILQKASALVPALVGGAADLAPSTKTFVNGAGEFSPDDRKGRNLHFGVRELGMGLVGNGMALSGVAMPYVSTFLVFSDYMKPALRLAAIQGLHVIYVFTHDSIFVGEDGPTHQPIEHTAMLRSIPEFTVIRPCDATEAAHAWAAALKAKGPVALLLTRQDLPPLPSDMAAKVAVDKGAYVLSDDPGFQMILIATGSEVPLALGAADALRQEGRKVRVVSMPSCELFLRQDKAYIESVLPASCPMRVSIEMGATFGWQRFTGGAGLNIGIDHFGASAPFKTLGEKFGFTVPQVVARIKAHFAA